MRTHRSVLTGVALPAALLLALPVLGRAQETPVVELTDGAAQLLMRGGVPSLDTFTLISGVRDATAGTLTLAYRQVDGDGSLTILTPDVPGTHTAAPRPPRGAAVTWTDVQGRSGARATCTVTWSDLPAGSIGGSFLCPKERFGKSKARATVAGTFGARLAPEDGVSPDPAPMPIYPPGTPVEVAGRTLTVNGGTDVASACIAGAAKGADRGACSQKQLPLVGTFRVVALSACVADGGELLRLLDRTGLSRVLYGGEPEALLPVGLPVAVVDSSVGTKVLPRVVNPGSCLDGHLVAGTQGPLVVWLPSGGEPAVGWTLDPVALPPTAEAPGPAASGAPSSPAPVAAGTSYTSGVADLVVDGPAPGSADDLVLTEGSYVSDGQGSAALHLAFASDGASLVIELPGPEGSFSWAAGAATPVQGVSATLGSAIMDAPLTGCDVEVGPTEAGGVQGSYACLPAGGGSVSGAFVANP